MQQRPILLVEDSPEDVEALQRAFRKFQFTRPVQHCATARSAWDYLCGQGELPAASPLPCLILLDLNLPGEDGRSFLQRLKANEEFKSVPVVIFSTSSNSRDVDFCYRHGAAAYQVKLMDVDEQQRHLHAMLDYWFGAAVLPSSEA
ncbi:response regulator [Hyalangium versicolor]|uniref:response regulator n=1 Tax=Hyalangium versicolor TaxID=2861190 RepID=UPI001CCA47E4|nr:response regulator [Hyalangium versicolor]